MTRKHESALQCTTCWVLRRDLEMVKELVEAGDVVNKSEAIRQGFHMYLLAHEARLQKYRRKKIHE